MRFSSWLMPALALALAAASSAAPRAHSVPADPRERHFADVRQLTSEGSNAEAYFSPDGRWLTFQSSRGPHSCDQIYRMNVESGQVEKVSGDVGRTTCSYFIPGTDRVVYASTRSGGDACPPRPDHSKGYVWPLFDTFDLYTSRVDGSDLRPITSVKGYDAEATASPDGSRLVFTSTRNGDLDLYTCRPDGSDTRQLTTKVGYDGGAFFSPNGQQLVYRSFHPRTVTELATYRSLLKQGLFKPTWLEIMMMDVGGTNQHAVTNLGAASFCPFFFPDGKRIIFASNHQASKQRQFDLWAVNTDGTDLERVTYQNDFDAFPMFSPDGKYIVWGSNRSKRGPHQTDIYIARWLP